MKSQNAKQLTKCVAHLSLNTCTGMAKQCRATSGTRFEYTLKKNSLCSPCAKRCSMPIIVVNAVIFVRLCQCYIICIIFMRIVCIKYNIDHNPSAMLLYHVNTSNICP